MKKILLLVLGLTSCGVTPTVVTTPVVAPLAPVAVPTITPMVLNPVKFQVMNSADVQNLAAQLKTSGKDEVIFSLDEQDYKNLLLNLNTINSYIQQETAVVELLEKINTERSSETTLPAKN